MKKCYILALLLNLTLFGCSNIISPSLPKKIPVRSIYHVRTVISIEYVTENSEYKLAISPEKLQEHIDFANKLYAPAGIFLDVTKIEMNQALNNYIKTETYNLFYENTLPICYLMPQRSFELLGESSMPWMRNTGIIIAYQCPTDVVSHEIGHYFGLLHTFNTDFCSDTVHQTNIYCVHVGDPNCGNIMNYCRHNRTYLTPQQIKRAHNYLVSDRTKYILLPSEYSNKSIDTLYNEELNRIQELKKYVNKNSNIGQ